MKIVAVCGSHKKGRTVDTLIDKAIDGVRAVDGAVEVEKIHLVDKHIEYCKGCMACHGDDPAKPIAKCPTQDDMQDIYRKLDDADGYILGCPTYEATVTAVMKTFLERICWVMARPGKRPFKGCPEPRNSRRKAAVLITSTGLAPAWLMRCLGATRKTFHDVIPCTLNAKIVGMLWACKVGMPKPKGERYFGQAHDLGKKLGRTVQRLAERRG